MRLGDFGNVRSKKQLAYPNGRKLIKDLRDQQHKELLIILEGSEKEEKERQRKLDSIYEENEKQRLEAIFAIERANSKERIVHIIRYALICILNPN
jgi:hypothetical protein